MGWALNKYNMKREWHMPASSDGQKSMVKDQEAVLGIDGWTL